MIGPIVLLIIVAGAAGVYLLMPGAGHRLQAKVAQRIGALVALGALFAGLVGLFQMVTSSGTLSRMDIITSEQLFFYFFAALALGFAVRVITHHRPVYCALYFILVVLSVSGMFLLLEAEFMAFAMVIIYGGAILVTYMFVIMLATLPQSAQDEDGGAPYDKRAREPFIAIASGFALLAVITSVVFNSTPEDLKPNIALQPDSEIIAMERLPGRLLGQENVVYQILREEKLIEAHEAIRSLPIDEAGNISENPEIVIFSRRDQQETQRIPLEKVADKLVGNVDYIGISLFEGHTLGIELAGVILLLAMVGAIIIARKRTGDEEDDGDSTGGDSEVGTA